MNASRHGGSFIGFLATLALGGLLGAGICYYLLKEAPARTGRSAAPVEREAPRPAPTRPEGPPSHEDYIARKLREWNLTPEDLKREVGAAGEIVREKGREFGNKVASATGDVTVIAKIKAKFTLDEQLSALKIAVGCKDGHVTLSGSVAAPELIGRAIVHALDTDGVVDVVSSLKVAAAPEPV